MQYTDLQTRAQVLASLEGWTDVTPSPDWPTIVNRAWLQFSWDSEILIAAVNVTTVIGTGTYTLPTTTNGPYKGLLDVTWDLGGANLPMLRSSEEFERNVNPAWLHAASGVPKRWTFGGFNQITLSPPPNAVKNVEVRGVVQGQNMVLATDQPGQVNGAGIPIPEAFHEAVAYRAAWLQGITYGNSQAASERLSQFESRYQELVAKSREDLLVGYRRKNIQEP